MSLSLKVGDRVLCYHGPKLYEAKVLEIQSSGESRRYFVHYKGWKSKWDEWVESERIMPYDNTGLELQKNLVALHSSAEDQSPTITDSVPAPRESQAPRNDSVPAKQELPLIFKLGKGFKFFSSFDWDQITRQSKILASPAEFSVADFLIGFARKQNNHEVGVFIDNFITFLNTAIGKNLLYRQERLHYMSLSRNQPVSTLYGPAILIRFFARLNIMLQTYHNHAEVLTFVSHFSKLLEYLIEYLQSVDMESCYIKTTEHYQNVFALN